MYNAFKASGISFNTPYTKRILKQYISKTAFGILYKQYNTYYRFYNKCWGGIKPLQHFCF